MRNLKFWIAAALILASGCVYAAEPVDIPSDDVKLRATLFRPSGPGPFPAVVAPTVSVRVGWARNASSASARCGPR
jgi:hypothetical protein